MLNLVVAVLLWPLEQLQRFASYTVTLTVNLTTVALFVTVTSVITFYVVRYHFLARYSRLPHHQATSEKAVLSSDLRPDTATQEVPERKYLPEEIFAQFLGSIKIFNYLDKTVLTEFSKRSQQRKLEPGELLWRSDERNRDLYLVMSGTMQVYLARHDFLQQQGLDGAAGDELLRDEFDGAHLLSEIKPGGTVSSLFDVLAIYADTMGALRQSRRQSVDTDLTPQSAPVGPSHASAYHDTMTASPDRGVTFEKSSTAERRHSILFARALTECTLLVIPEAAFIRVGEKFPQTATQIAHIILTRFQRVTFLTLYKYLGMTKELINIERTVNEFCGDGLPANFVLERSNLERLRDLPKHRMSADHHHYKEAHSTSNDSLHEMLSRSSALFHQNQDLANSFEHFDGHHPYLVADNRRHQPPVKPAGSPEHQRSVSVTAAMLEPPTLSDQELRKNIFEFIADSIGLPLDAPAPSPPPRDGILTPLSNAFSRTSLGSSPNAGLRNRNPLLSRLESHESAISASNESMGSPAMSRMSLSSTGSEIEEDLQILFFEEGSTLVRQSERNAGLFFVIDGVLDVLMKRDSDATKTDTQRDHLVGDEEPLRKIFKIYAGGLAGYLAALTGHPSFVTIRAASDTYVGFLPKASMDRIVEKYPRVLMTLAKRLTATLSPMVRHIDFALEWVQVTAGKVLFRQNDPVSDCIYVVLNGRLRSIEERREGGMVSEYGQGESVGELEVLTNSPRSATVHAIRDTELARMPKTLFNALSMRHPEITIQISRIIASRSKALQQTNQQMRYSRRGDTTQTNLNLKTVALIPTNENVAIMDFAERLRDALQCIHASAIVLDSATVTSVLGRHAFTRMGKLKLLSWLTEQEEKARLVLYVADSAPTSPWTQRCIRQADCILMVAISSQDQEIGEFERFMLNMKTTARKELVLLHPERHVRSGTARGWLQKRPWVHAHHHVQMPLSINSRAPVMKRRNPLDEIKSQFEKFTRLYARSFSKRIVTPKNSGPRSDFARLARRLTGRSIGLALGGGGARGIAHIGIIQAFEDAGIPIDMVGGTSIGSFIGGLYSRYEDIWYTYWRAKDFASRMTSVWRQLLDLTYPVTSWFTGHEFNRTIWKGFGQSEIEDTWLSYFCVTTNITHSRLEIHTAGYLWRYVRASMSLSGFLPPLCDQGNMLLDGGYLNNLPGDVIRSLGADTVIAVDVGSEDDTSPATYGDSLSGWWAMLLRMKPWGKPAVIPSLAEIQSRLAYVSCVKQLEEVKNMDGCYYLHPPVSQFATLDFGRFEEIYEVGYKYGQEVVKEWEVKGLLNQWRPTTKKPRKNGRRNSV